MTSCERCPVLESELEKANSRIGVLQQELAELGGKRDELLQQLAEMAKLCELQQADLERYKKAYEQSRPNHPERAPRQELELAFKRVVGMFGADKPANDEPGGDGDNSGTGDGDNSGTGDGDTGGTGGTGEPLAETKQEPDNAKRRKKEKKRDRHGRRPLDRTNLPVIEHRITPDEVKAVGGEGYELIGEESSDRVALLPAAWVIYRITREKYARVGDERSPSTAPRCGGEQATDPAILVAPLPAGVWPNVMADPGAIAHVIISKYDDLLPLNRQQHISARSGFMLPKSTQSGWIKAAYSFCSSLVDAMFNDGIENAFLIATDATGARVLPKRSSGEERLIELMPGQARRCESWHVFVFIADRDHIVFRYDHENNGDVMAKMLAGFHGNIQADASSIFDILYREHGMTEHGCWFHCRRPFYRAIETDPQRAYEALALISKLFEIDRELRLLNLDLETFTRRRRELASPILKLFDDWIKRNRGQSDPRSPLDTAIGYYDNQREALHRFLKDGRIRLDNNLSEQALRNLVVGLANWIFFANENGIAWYTTFRSLIASCILHQLNPQIYLEQLLRIIPHWPKNRVLELAPKYWTDTVAKLDDRWRAILARPWEPDVVLSAKQETCSHHQAQSATAENAA